MCVCRTSPPVARPTRLTRSAIACSAPSPIHPPPHAPSYKNLTIQGNRPECIPYGETEYWNLRYDTMRKREGVDYKFEWYVTPAQLWPVVETFCGTQPDAARVLIVGCGNSGVAADMYGRGYTSIVSIDLSNVVVALMRNRNAGREGMEFLVMDARAMHEFSANTFDIIIEKGCMDCLFCEGRSYVAGLLRRCRSCRYYARVLVLLRGGAAAMPVPCLFRYCYYYYCYCKPTHLAS
jgi:SAM-dependent methyltransferase